MGETFLWAWNRQRILGHKKPQTIKKYIKMDISTKLLLYSSKDIVKKTNMKDTDWGKIFSMPVSDKSVNKEYSELLQLNDEQSNNSRKKWAKESQKTTRCRIPFI